MKNQNLLDSSASKRSFLSFGFIKRRPFATGSLSTAVAVAAVLIVHPNSKSDAEGPGGWGLSQADLRTIISQAVAGANTTNSPLRSLPGTPRTTKMQIAVVDRDGKLLTRVGMPDAWVGSEDIAI